MSNTSAFATFAILAVLVSGCSSAGGQGDAPKGGLAGFVERCSGYYICDGGGIWTPQKVGQQCFGGDRVLREDGQVLENGKPVAIWAADESSITFCEGNECLTCKNPSGPSTTSQASKSCTGSPFSCSGRGASSCASQSGCYMASHVKWDGSLESKCEGSADSCDSMDEYSCEEQSGCTWE